jgi:hypothetical protein
MISLRFLAGFLAFGLPWGLIAFFLLTPRSINYSKQKPGTEKQSLQWSDPKDPVN